MVAVKKVPLPGKQSKLQPWITLISFDANGRKGR
jgi:hypothetical protein